MKNRLLNLALVLILFVGLGLVLYPSFSDYWNSFHQSRVIAHYTEALDDLTNEEFDRLMEEAEAYNERWFEAGGAPHVLTEEEITEYNNLLSFNGTGMMGYIEIPSIGCYLSIYHGTSEAVLQVATGHIEWTSLPVGGENTHAVISGHRGLPSAKLFTELDKLRTGDKFSLFILGKELDYEVCQINTVTPEDIDLMRVYPGEDYVTLVTCTPYGINTHRLLVRGTRIETVEDRTLHFTSEAMLIDTVVVASVIAVPVLLILLLMVALGGGGKAEKEREKVHRKALALLREEKSLSIGRNEGGNKGGRR